MSCITENTLVIMATDAPKVGEVFEKANNNGCRIGTSLERVYADGNILVYIYDCNGDSLDFILDGGITPLLQETCYGKREVTTYRFDKKKGGMVNTRYHIPFLIKKYIDSPINLRVVRKAIKYTID